MVFRESPVYVHDLPAASHNYLGREMGRLVHLPISTAHRSVDRATVRTDRPWVAGGSGASFPTAAVKTSNPDPDMSC